MAKWYEKNVGDQFLKDRQELQALLAEETKLMEIVKLIGSDVLPDDQKLIIEISRIIRVGYLQQNAFHKDDTYVPLAKQLKMMDVILYLYHRAKGALGEGKSISSVLETGLFDKIVKMKYDVPNDHIEMLDDYMPMIDDAIAQIQ